MTDIEKEIFVCLDCEATGLDPKKDRIVEMAIITFDAFKTYDSFETLVNPKIDIPKESIAIHRITDEMVQDQPSSGEVLQNLLDIVGERVIVGHGIEYDIELIASEAERSKIACTIKKNRFLDTLRMARLYGGSPKNSLEHLCKHFNVPSSGAHRAMNDVKMNVAVFQHLCREYKTTERLFKALSKPILMKEIPFGKHKGRSFKEIPLDYLQRLAGKDFDQDLLFSIRTEINRRKKGNLFSQANNPFQHL